MVKELHTFFDKKILKRYKITSRTLVYDLLAGLTVAPILIPQSLAYAQLAGLPSHYGLYAAFLPLIVGALFGSSRFLSTGPVAIVSLITASILSSLPTASVQDYIMFAVMLALLVGIIQLSLGLLKLGVIVNFLSHPVIIGFTNAAAIIIAFSQLPKIFGLSTDNYDHFYQTVYHFVIDAFRYTHLFSILIACTAFIIMYTLKKYYPRLPAIFIAVIICTLISAFSNFEEKTTIPLSAISSAELKNSITTYNEMLGKNWQQMLQKNRLLKAKRELKARQGYNLAVLDIDSSIVKLDFEINELEEQILSYRRLIRFAKLSQSVNNTNQFYYAIDDAPWNLNFKQIWRINIGEKPIDTDALNITTGGHVIGEIPAGLPLISFPRINLSVIPSLFSSALIIAVIGFTQSIAIARSLAVHAGDRIDPNRELVGQGLANIAGSFSQSYPVSGSFACSAVNYNGGAKTIFSNIFAAVLVLITLLFFTPLLYYLPQPVLAVIIIMSVGGLINIKKIREAWRVNRNEGIIILATFACTLLFAPHLDKGILFGIILSTGYYIFTRTRPRIVELSADGSNALHDIKLFKLKTCRHIKIIRFDGSLFFANAAHLENKLDNIVNTPARNVRAVVLLADGINYIDFSGIESLAVIAGRFKDAKIKFVIAQMKSHILNIVKKSAEIDSIGNSIFQNAGQAIGTVYGEIHSESKELNCPLKEYVNKL